MDKYCKYCLRENYGANPSLYHILWHVTEKHGTDASDVLNSLVIPHICKGCMETFEAGLQYRSNKSEFLVDAYCSSCVADNRGRKLVADQVSRSAILRMREDLRLEDSVQKSRE